jgi:two-component system, NarL family, sensor kinase
MRGITPGMLIYFKKVKKYIGLSILLVEFLALGELYLRQPFSAWFIILVVIVNFLIFSTFYLLERNLNYQEKIISGFSETWGILQAVVDATEDIIWVKDVNGKFLLINKRFKSAYNISVDVIGKTNFEIFPSKLAENFQSIDTRVIKEKKGCTNQTRFSDSRIYYTNIFPLSSATGVIYAIAGISTNIADVVTKEEFKRQKEIASTAIEAQEKERAEISRELHDNVNQILATAKIMLDTALSVPALKDHCIEKSRSHVIDGISEIRKISHVLRPPTFDEEEFTEAIEHILDDVKLYQNLATCLRLIPGRKQVNSIDQKFKIVIYRIIQEQVNNVIKYAGAHSLVITICLTSNSIITTINDDGSGFDKQQCTKGIGLKNMENRVELVNGKMVIETAPGAGCCIRLEIPVMEPSQTSLNDTELSYK